MSSREPVPCPNRLRGRVALVTGAGGGIGAAVARRLAAEGAAVVVADIDGEAASRVEAQVRQDGGMARAVPMDVTSSADRDRAIVTAKQLGSLHIVVNCG